MRALRRLFEHMQWADQRVLESLSAAAPPRAVELYGHVLAAEHVWLTRLRRRPSEFAVWPSLTREECAKLAADNARGYAALLDELDQAQLVGEVAYTNSAGASFRSRVEDILLHVCLHGSYHRGQVALLLRSAGVPPASTDYIAFVRGAPAATRVPPP